MNAGSGQSIRDRFGNVWTISTSAVIIIDGVADTTSQRVLKLAYLGGNIWYPFFLLLLSLCFELDFVNFCIAGKKTQISTGGTSHSPQTFGLQAATPFLTVLLIWYIIGRVTLLV